MSFEPQNDGGKCENESCTPEVSHSASGGLNLESARAAIRSSKLRCIYKLEKHFTVIPDLDNNDDLAS